MPMKHYSLSDLSSALSKYVAVSPVNSKTGTALVTDYGARLIGLFPDKELPNTLWAHENISTILLKHQWMLGGERLWISPECDFYYENPRDFEGHHVPAGMDPGSYKTVDVLTYRNNFPLLNTRINETYDDCIAERVFSPLNDPYTTGLHYAGISIRDSIRINEAHIPMCCWSLAQVFCNGPAKSGTALFPTKGVSVPVPYFGVIPADRWDAKAGYARFKIDVSSIYKFTIRPEDIDWNNPVKAMYVSPYPVGDKWFCIVKQSNDLPKTQEQCVDPSLLNPAGPKGAIQSYNAGTNAQGITNTFGEIELQLSKGVFEGDATVARGQHDVLSYAGTKAEILELAKKLLNIPELPAVY